MTFKFTAAAKGKLIVDPHIEDHVVDPRIVITLQDQHSSETEFALPKDAYRVSVHSSCGHLIEMHECPSWPAVAEALGKLLPGEVAAEALGMAANHFHALSGGSAKFHVADDGIAFWAGFRRPERHADLGRCVDGITGFDGRVDQGFPLLTLPIERFSLGASVARDIRRIYRDDLACVHHNAMTLRDRAAAAPWFATEAGKEAHDQFELGRRAAAGALLQMGVMDADKAAAALAPLRSHRGHALEGTPQHGTAFDNLLAAVGLHP